MLLKIRLPIDFLPTSIFVSAEEYAALTHLIISGYELTFYLFIKKNNLLCKYF